DLKWIRQVRGTRDARQVAPHFRIQAHPILTILFSFRQGPCLVWNPAAIDDAQSWRNRADGAELESLLRRRPAALAFKIPIRRIQDLPNTIKVRFAITHSRYWIPARLRLSRSRCDGEQNNSEYRSRETQQRVSKRTLHRIELLQICGSSLSQTTCIV